MDLDFSKIEQKWQNKWRKDKIFESNIDPKREKKYITAAFPYPNSPQHIGHARTYTTADIYARYLRLRGYNVLYPMAFHVTGTPILAMAKRIANKEKDVLEVFDKIYGINESEAAKLNEPKTLVAYFSKEIEQGMHEIGFSMDWRRKFYSYDEKFNKFIQWQFRKLKEKEYLIKGEYPIAWCRSDNNAVSAHDTKGDVDPELEEVTAIKFEVSKDTYLIVSTYRPETIYGVTNIWINPKFEYVKARIKTNHNKKEEVLILSAKAAEALNLQLQLEIIASVSAEELLKMSAKNPIDDRSVPVYAASFVKEDVGTGIVMSVPAHAPLDYLALRDAGKADHLIQVVSVNGYSSAPAKDAVEKLKVKDQLDPFSEQATKEIYTKEAYEGVMIVGKYIGEKASLAKDKVSKELLDSKHALMIHVILNPPVHCRCGANVVVNIIKDQWFIDYGKPEWKKLAKEALDDANVIPQKTRSEYEYTINWLKTRPCTRAAGLGTKFPFDETKMIEALSDSTIYMAYYTIAHLLEEIRAEEMNDEFFDYVFLGKESAKHKTENTKLKKLRESFLYWYPVDSRHSAGDLIRNHLTLYLFIHTAIFEKKLWPKQLVTNGFVLMDGKKMSKSMGNITPLRKAIKDYSADIIRFAVVSGADLATDSDFSRTVADGVRSRLEFIYKLAIESKESKKVHKIDQWILSRINKKIKNAEKLYEELAIRELSLEIFYDVVSDLQWYTKRTDKPNLKSFLAKWCVLISPFMPHFAEELNEILGGKELVTTSNYPKFKDKIDEKIEMEEEFVKSTRTDIEKISSLLVKDPTTQKVKQIEIVVASPWKKKLYDIVKKEQKFELVMKACSQDSELKSLMADVQRVVKQLVKNAYSLTETLNQKEEIEALNDAKGFFEKEFGCSVHITTDSESKSDRAKLALPGKPAISLEIG